MEYLNTSDTHWVKKLINRILMENCQIEVWNGGDEPECKATKDKKLIYKAIGATGEDVFKLISNDGEYKGHFYCIYNNGDGIEVICDHSDNEICNTIYAHIDN